MICATILLVRPEFRNLAPDATTRTDRLVGARTTIIYSFGMRSVALIIALPLAA